MEEKWQKSPILAVERSQNLENSNSYDLSQVLKHLKISNFSKVEALECNEKWLTKFSDFSNKVEFDFLKFLIGQMHVITSDF